MRESARELQNKDLKNKSIKNSVRVTKKYNLIGRHP